MGHDDRAPLTRLQMVMVSDSTTKYSGCQGSQELYPGHHENEESLAVSIVPHNHCAVICVLIGSRWRRPRLGDGVTCSQEGNKRWC